MHKVLLIQPGKLGDLILTIPIAKYYSEQGYMIDWPVFDNFYNFLTRFDFINPIKFGVSLDDGAYHSKNRSSFVQNGMYMPSVGMFQHIHNLIKQWDYKVVDPCFSLPGHNNMGNEQHKEIFARQNYNWIHQKYYLCDVPLKERWNFSTCWKRNKVRENNLLEVIKKKAVALYGSENYSLLHTYSGYNIPSELKNIIKFEPIGDYEILDWCRVILEADAVACVDSALANFIEVLPEAKDIKKYYLGTEEAAYHPWMRNILLNEWVNMSHMDLSYSPHDLAKC